ncbi:capsule biosynthesis protein [Sulfitobacter sp. TSTF-M16]|uniref:Capsule biosynthesis protein n=1 Tax=Sulfitobacter aestuariivivens TaxID=2766981 RepID=A0A927HEU0_9RHOB|nr:capsule biosynthesis protein [Sulfitobacter aestuariivivens]
MSEPAPPRVPPGGAGVRNVKPVAKPARPRRRHFFLFLSFLAVVVIPAAVASFYLWTRAADQYASNLAFSVRTEEQSSAIELLGGITELSGSSSSDTDILYAYLTSQELVSKVDARVDLRDIWSKPGVDQDPIFAFDPDGTIEDLQSHWERKISIVYDSGTGLIDLEVLAFDPQDALHIAEVVLDECGEMINGLSQLAREDAISFTREELESSLERLKVARKNLTQFRNRNQLVDPAIDTQNQMGLLTSLQAQLAEALIEYDLLQDTTRESDPRIAQSERRIEAINERIASERRKLGLGDDEEGDAFADIVGEFEGLMVDREYAERAYNGALAAHDGALAEVRKQSRYLAAHVKPTLAQKAEYPQRTKIMGLWLLFAFFAWAIICLVYYSVRDRS